MPYLAIKIAAPCLPETVDRCATRMTALVVGILRQRRDVTAATVHCLPPGHWYVGGAALTASGRTSFCVEVDVTAGSSSAQEKTEFVAAAFAAAESILGRLDAASYVIVRDLPAEAWGYQGRTQEQRAAERRRDAASSDAP